MSKPRIVCTDSFCTLFNELRAIRSSYESLRNSGGSLSDRVDRLERLHFLRAELAIARQDAGL